MNTAAEILKAKRVKVIKAPHGSYIKTGDVYDVTKDGKEVHFRNIVTNGATYIKNYDLELGEFEAA